MALPGELVFTKEELLRFANIFDNAGQVFLAGMVIAPFFSAVEIIFTFVVPFRYVSNINLLVYQLEAN